MHLSFLVRRPRLRDRSRRVELVALVSVTSVLCAGACGGKVVAEPGLAEGGAGGSTSSVTTSASSTMATGTSTTTVTTSTSTGPSCACDAFCEPVIACGFAGVECQSYCDQIPPETMQCVCANANGIDCDAIVDCLSSSTTGPGSSGAGGSGGGDGTPSDECFQCAGEVAGCDDTYAACEQDAECLALIDCHNECGWTFECNGICDQQHPGGYPEFYSLVTCAVCGPCFDPCASSSLASYCFDG